ncbi:MAG: GspE/PulE family protein [Pseudomonadota bacterium]
MTTISNTFPPPIETLEGLYAALDRPQQHFIRLQDYLLQNGLVTQEQLAAARQEQEAHPQQRLGDILVAQKALLPSQLTLALRQVAGIPAIRLAAFPEDRAAISRLSPNLMHRHRVMPVTAHRDGLVVACAELPSPDVMQQISFQAGSLVYLVQASVEDIQAAIFRQFDAFSEEVAAATTLVGESAGADYQQLWRDAEFLAKQAPIVRLVGSFILEGIRRHASDVHLRPAATHIDLLYRLDGTLVHVQRWPHHLLPALVSRIKILAQLDITERRLPQDGHLKTSHAGQEIDIRVSILPTNHGESVVMRILNKQVGLHELKDIGFSPADEERFRDLIRRSSGMLLVTGPTGSGKTSTLYAALQDIYDKRINVITVEDPVEYELDGMTQVQLLDAVGFGFPQTLRHILRHDPDVIMIGEIRDAETCKIALEAALTGHLVLSTLHTADAPSAVMRLQEMGMSQYLIRSALIGVLGQRLIRLNCPHCLEEEAVSPYLRTQLGLSADDTFWHGAGCVECDHTGFHGRASIHELFVIDDDVRNAIREEMTAPELRAIALRAGMRPLLVHGLAFAREKKASLLEIYRASM